MGDPAGIGPEIIAASWGDTKTQLLVRRFVVGDVRVMQAAIDLYQLPIKIRPIRDLAEVNNDPETLSVWPIQTDASLAPRCQVSSTAGAAAAEALSIATRMALAREIDAIVTAPLNKASLHAAGITLPGHTELLAEHCGVQNVAMMLHIPHGPSVAGEVGISVVHVTLHTALRNVFSEMTIQAIVDKCQLATQFTQAMLAAREIKRPPRIGVAALNPHGGENGLFGDEEIRIIGPAVSQAQKLGFPVVGPLPCDTLMHRAADGEFDTIVAMYHDQGHIALKLLGLQRAVNITLGLPIIRTSVAHGTAFDIAWKGVARCESMLEAIRTAAYLAAHRRLLIAD
jgi:4-hydroxythreonine-4-phosphate dehydrogenase